MNQDTTWYRRRPRPGHTVLDGDSAQNPPLLFGPCLLWQNGWMDQDTTWYGGRPRRRRHCVRWKPSAPPRQGEQQPAMSTFLTSILILSRAFVFIRFSGFRLYIELCNTPVDSFCNWRTLSNFSIVLYCIIVAPWLWPNGRTSHQLLSSCLVRGYHKVQLILYSSTQEKERPFPGGGVLDLQNFPLSLVHGRHPST